jgi:hypothetical protein
MTWTGTRPVTVSGGKIHTNSRYRMVGSVTVVGNVHSGLGIGSTGTTGIEGDTAAPVYDGKSPQNITGVVYTGPVASLPIPDIDLAPYYNHALANGEVYQGSRHFTGSGVLMPCGGVMWVNGDLQISGTMTMVGCFIATGSIKISTAGAHEKVANYPAFVSRDGSIDVSGTGDIHGLIYAKTGGFAISGGGRVVGSIIAAGTFTKTGSFAIMAYENSTPVPPGDPGVVAGSDTVCVWQK